MKKVIAVFVFLLLILVGCFQQPLLDENSEEMESPTIGFIGCSNTRETVEGYHYLGGKKMWDYERRYGSGTILDWSKNVDEGSKYWDVFDKLLEKYPETKTIWWELCIMDEDRTTSYEHAGIILNEIRERIPDAVIYVSALADYTDGVCSITGTWGLEKAKELTKELDDKNQDVFAGPVLGPMTPLDTAEDGCHLSSPDGKRKLGKQMRLFFDAEEYSADEASIGYVGCSNTMQTIAAYWSVGGSEDRIIWKFDEQELHEYDEGAVADWSKGAEKGNKFWKTFDRYLEGNPNTKAVFWQLCIRKEEPTPYEEALLVLEAIRNRIPGAVIYVSPLPPYTEGVCEITGAEGIERAKALAEELDSKNDDVLLGPVLGPMAPEDTDEDGCHLSEEGFTTLGQQMRIFFDDKQDDEEVEESKEDNEKDMEELSSEDSEEEQVWKERIDAAFEPTDCPPVASLTYPQGHYTGPLIDSHLHIPNIPDAAPGHEEDYVSEKIIPILGVNIKMKEIVCTLEHEGTLKAFAFFSVYPQNSKLFLEVADKTMQQYPTKFVPFISPPSQDKPTVDADELRKMLTVYPDLFKGYGEIGLYADDLPPNAPIFQEIYPLVQKHELMVYMHPGEGHTDNFKEVLEQYPDINFLVHGEQIEKGVGDLMGKYPNIYFTVNDLYGDQYLLHPGENTKSFLAATQNYEPLLQKDLATWKNLIEAHPDQFMWGTDRGGIAVWTLDREVGIRLADYGRAFIGRLNPSVQEKFAYKNAERLLQDE